MLRPRLIRAFRPSLVTRPQRRCLHEVPPLDIEKLIPEQKNIPGFLSEVAFHSAWYEYQYLMLSRLNQVTVGTDLDNKDVKAVAMATARDPSKAHIFNYASMAHNNHFFFKNITVPPKGGSLQTCPDRLRKALEINFSSMDTLRKEMIATANAMFGPGFVWLVKVKMDHTGLGPNTYRILPTYLAGSPYPQAHWRKQPVDTNTIGEAGGLEGTRQAQETLANQQRTYQPVHKDEKKAPGGVEQLTPLLCVNTWEHVWTYDYGFGVYEGLPGKKGYLEAWWDAINWEKVAEVANTKSEDFLRS